MPDSQTQSSPLNCLDEGVQYHNEKAELWKEMNDVAKECSRDTRLEKKVLMKVKDYIHYRGRGWGEDCLEKAEETEKYPDRVSPTFRHLVEIIKNLYETGKEENLDVYLDAVKERGITISIDVSKFTLPSKDVKDRVAVALSVMDPLQCQICEKNDYMNDVLAVAAEEANLSPKDKYKKIVKLAASKRAGHDVDDKVHDEFVKTELFTNGLEVVDNIEQH